MDQKEFDRIKSTDVICVAPFTSLYNANGEAYTPCCWATWVASDKTLHDTLPFDHFDGEDFRRLRKEMLVGEKTEFLKKYCSQCWKSESEIGGSLRKVVPITKDIFENFDKDGKLLDNGNPVLRLALNFYGNYCNLQCYECHPQNSTGRNEALKKIGPEWNGLDGLDIRRYSPDEDASYILTRNSDIKKINPDQFNKIKTQLKENAHRISVIDFCGGEPALMKSHFEILDALIDSGYSHQIDLSYVSNLTIMNLSMMKRYFDKFKFIWFQWSVDAIDKRNYWLRYPTDWQQTTTNAKEIQKYLITNNKGRIESAITPSILGIVSLRETFNWLYIRKFVNHTTPIVNRVTHPNFLNSRHLPNELKKEIGPKILSVSEYHYNDLMMERNEEKFQLALKYFDALDKSRGTDWKSTFPEVAKYAN